MNLTPKNRKRLYFLLAAFLACATAFVAALFFSTNLLRIEDPAVEADVIVVLGGEVGARPARALELFLHGAATNVIVTGAGDCDSVRLVLTAKGVPASAIRLECESRTTRENAILTIPLLRAQHAKRVILVTSWFHSRRALYCFRHFAPDIQFISLPTTTDLPPHHWPNRWERRSVLAEYPKVLYYLVRFGIPSW